jgi:hypothetical protein
MIYGFTGSRELVNPEMILRVLKTLEPESLVVTGGCVGVDAFIAEHAHSLGHHVITILPADRKLVDPNWSKYADWYEDVPRTYEQRNERIVEICAKLFGFPLHPEADPRSNRSGTWQTIRKAKRSRREVTVYLQMRQKSPITVPGT